MSTLMRDERGNATITFAMWLPFFAGLLMLVTDLSMIMFHRTNADRILQDANRMRATGVLADDAATKRFITAGLTRSDGTIVGTGDSGIVRLTASSVIRMQLSDIDVFGGLAALIGDREIEIRNRQALEDMEV